MAGEAPVRRHYEALFFVGIAVVIVLLPFPNVFGILLDMAVLATAYPIIGWKASVALVYAYNFNPVKLNGVLGLYYVFYSIGDAMVQNAPVWEKGTFLTVSIIVFMVVVSFAEFLAVRLLSRGIWRLLEGRDPRLRKMQGPAKGL